MAVPDLVLSHLTLPHLLPPDMISVAAEAGFQGISVRLIPANPPAERQLPMFGASPLLAETIARLDATGIGVNDIEVLKLDASPDLAALDRVMESAARLRARNLIVVGLDDDEARLVDNLGAVAELCAGYGVRACIEPMVFSRIKTLGEASRLIDRTGRADIGLIIDPLHIDRAGDGPADVAGLAPERIAWVQLCDAGPRPDPSDLPAILAEARDQRLVPGRGTLPLREIMAVLPAGLPVAVEVPTKGLIGTRPDAEIAAMMRDAVLEILGPR